MSSKRLNLVVAACVGNGIGVKGQLPWRLKGDMAFFKKITTNTEVKDKKNAVIMGRKTWESIPEKFRPLPGRINIVISRSWTEKDVPEGVLVASSLEGAVEQTCQPPHCDIVENLFVIGGSSIYQMAFESSFDLRLYLTRVLAEFECDTFLPTYDAKAFHKIQDASVEETEQVEGDICYKFEVYDKTVHT